MERRYIGVKLLILDKINKETGSLIELYTILYVFLLYLEFLILVYIKSSSCSQEEQLRQVNTRNSSGRVRKVRVRCIYSNIDAGSASH